MQHIYDVCTYVCKKYNYCHLTPSFIVLHLSNISFCSDEMLKVR